MEDKQRDGVSGLKCAPCRVCDGLLLHGAQLMQQADTESNPKNHCYQCGFHTADPVLINTLRFSFNSQ